MTMENYDVLIIGGGPAGSSLASGLRGSGLNVAIVDKKSFPRDKTCAGWITPAVVADLGIDLDDYKKHNTLQAITGFRVGTIHGDSINIHYGDTPVSYGIRRYELDHYLLQRSGTKFYPDFTVSSITRNEHGWIINDSITARMLVGAGGNFCPVARLLGAKFGKTETVVRAQEIEYRLNETQARHCPVSPEVPELYFCEDLKGYGWVFRKGDYLNVGLGREDESGLPGHVKSFRNHLIRLGRIPADTPGNFHGHSYLLYDHSHRPLYAEGLLLIGDAAGLAYTESGEGIHPAVVSGLIAARIILGAKGDYSRSGLHPYQTAIRQCFGKPEPGTSILYCLIPTSIKPWLVQSLLGTAWFVREVVIGKWFLHRHQTHQ